MEKKKKKIMSLPLALYVAAAILLLFSTVGSTRAALTYSSENYEMQIEVPSIGVSLVENGVIVGSRDYVGNQWTESGGELLTNMLGENEKLVLGKSYPEALSVHNSGTIDSYVRVVLYKSWTKDGETVADTELSPDLIALNLTGNGWIEEEELEAICGAGILAVRGVKPFADHDRIYRCIEHDEKCGAVAVCMDIDHIFDPNGKYCDAPYGKLGRQTVADLRGYAASTKLPLILKGVLTAEDAEKAVEAGAGAIIVTNHNNRFPSCIPPLAALPEIKRAVNGQIPVLVDGCIESGVEAFKALALGADGVMVCRALMKAFSKGGPEAVTEKLNQMTGELAGCMACTGAASVKEISPEAVCRRNF